MGAKMPRSLGNRGLLRGSELGCRQQQCLLDLLGNLLIGQRGEEARPACAKADPNPAFRQRVFSTERGKLDSPAFEEHECTSRGTLREVDVTKTDAAGTPQKPSEGRRGG
jgi:hypothetical protein